MNALIKRSTVPLAPQLDYFLIDGSGSMKSKWWDTLAALDAFASTLRAARATSHGIVSVFSGRSIQILQRDSLLADWKTFAEDPLASTWQGTPLYDAINLMGRHLQELNPTRCSIVIVTDGNENESKTSVEQARAVLDWCRAHGWTVTFLGADFNNCTSSTPLGVACAASYNVWGNGVTLTVNTLSPVTVFFAQSVVPEPRTWALAILGLGAAGAMLRRRRAAALAGA